MSLRSDTKGRLRGVAPYNGSGLVYWKLLDQAVKQTAFHDFWCQVAICALAQMWRHIDRGALLGDWEL